MWFMEARGNPGKGCDTCPGRTAIGNCFEKVWQFFVIPLNTNTIVYSRHIRSLSLCRFSRPVWRLTLVGGRRYSNITAYIGIVRDPTIDSVDIRLLETCWRLNLRSGIDDAPDSHIHYSANP
jgi:hypothetical protein